MKNYSFECSDESRLKKTILVSFAIFSGSGIYVLFSTQEEWIVFAGLAIAGIFFYFNTRTIKQKGTAQLGTDKMTLTISGKTQTIHFNDIKEYPDGRTIGNTFLRLTFRNGKKIVIAANENFCDEESLDIFITDVTETLEKYNEQNPKAVRLQTALNPFASSWMYGLTWLGIILIVPALIPVLIWGDIYKLFAWMVLALGIYRTGLQ